MKLNLRSIDLNLLPVFEAVMETRQYSKAAEQLAMSQPAMSAAIQRLRGTLKDPLFVRTSKGIIPTPKAEALYQDIRVSLSQIRQSFSSQQGFNPKTQQHTFRILSGDYFEFVLLPQLIKTIESNDLQVRLNLNQIPEDSAKQIIHAQADVLLDVFPIEDDRVYCEVVSEETLVVVINKTYNNTQYGKEQSSAAKKTITAQDFFNATHAVLPNRGRLLPLDKILDTPLLKERKIGVQVTQYIGLLTAVANSDHIATVPKQLAIKYADAFGLDIYDFPIDIPSIPLYMIWSKAFDHDPASKWLLNQLREVIKNTF